MRDLEINIFILFILDFANDAISYFFLFLTIDFYLLIPEFIAQTFDPIVEIVIPIGITIKEAKAEMETHPVSVGAKIKRWSI